MEALLHVTDQAKWAAAAAAGRIPRPPGGFIHLCSQAQLDFVLSRHFAGAEGLVLLTLDPTGLDIRWEASEPEMPPFPHLYADLRCGCVVRTRAL